MLVLTALANPNNAAASAACLSLNKASAQFYFATGRRNLSAYRV